MERPREMNRVNTNLKSPALAVLACLAIGGVAPAWANGKSNPTTTSTTSTASTSTTLSTMEVAGLKYMREEEKVAHDVYAALYEVWHFPVFSNIESSEATHMSAMLSLLVNYRIPDPAAGNAAGVFTDPKLQALYDQLLAKGQTGAVEALSVGALIEETDIRDIEAQKALTDHTDILRTYDNLLCGSRNHLRAFNAQLLTYGVSYESQVISQATWDAIATSPTEQCGGSAAR